MFHEWEKRNQSQKHNGDWIKFSFQSEMWIKLVEINTSGNVKMR